MSPPVIEEYWGISEQTRTGQTSDVRSILTAFLACTVMLAGFWLTSPSCRHWFSISVLLCGALIGADALDWFGGRRDVFDPIGLLGVLGVHFFFLAPLLHVHWDLWMAYVTPPDDWRDWLGVAGLLNCAGLVIYRCCRDVRGSVRSNQWGRPFWAINRDFPIILALALVITGALQLWIYIRFGGIGGYIKTYLDGERHYGATSGGFVGMGWLFMIAESFPILAMMGFAAVSRTRRVLRGWPVLSVVLVLFFALQMIFGGLRGSRSNTIWGLVWAVGIIHFWIRPLTRNVVWIGLGFLVTFMYFYSFYKHGGTEALAEMDPAQHGIGVGQRDPRLLQGLILGDFGRSDVQAFAVYKSIDSHSDYQFAWGQTYLGALSILIPSSIWPNRPPTKIQWTTEMETGRGSFEPGYWQSSRVYGLAGEAMLNFGPAAVPFAFCVLGLVTGWMRRCMLGLLTKDSRFLIMPLGIMFSFLLLVNDSENNIFFLIKYGAIPFSVVALGSTRTRRAWEAELRP